MIQTHTHTQHKFTSTPPSYLFGIVPEMVIQNGLIYKHTHNLWLNCVVLRLPQRPTNFFYVDGDNPLKRMNDNDVLLTSLSLSHSLASSPHLLHHILGKPMANVDMNFALFSFSLPFPPNQLATSKRMDERAILSLHSKHIF